MDKPISFFCGKIPHVESRLEEALEFTSLFDDDDKYYAAIVFEERLELKITKADPFILNFLLPKDVYENKFPLYNLTVKENEEFFIASAEKLESLKKLCQQFGFKYDDQSGSSV